MQAMVAATRSVFAGDRVWDLVKATFSLVATVLVAWFAYRREDKRRQLERRRIACEALWAAVGVLRRTLGHGVEARESDAFEAAVLAHRADLGNGRLGFEVSDALRIAVATDAEHREESIDYFCALMEELYKWRDGGKTGKVPLPPFLMSSPAGGSDSDF